MNTESSLVDRSASVPLLRRLVAADALRPDEAQRMEANLRADLPWRLWLDRGLLVLGVILIVAGIGYFFAHNWRHLTENDKLGLSAGSVLVAFLGAVYAGFDHFIGKLSLLAASMLAGVFLAVFGQVYQSTEETYVLFLVWAALILPWVILGRFVPLWLFCLGLVNAALGFYWSVTTWFFSDPNGGLLSFRMEMLSLVVLNLAALALREWAAWKKVPWLDRHWSAWLLLAAVLVAATTETTYEVFRTWDSSPDITGWPAVFAVVLQVLLILGMASYFFRIRPSLPALALTTLSACWIATILAIRLVFPDHGDPDAGTLLIMGFLILGIFGGGVYLLRRASRSIAH